MTQPVLVSLESGVQKITLNRPDKLNSFTAEVHAALSEALGQGERDLQRAAGLSPDYREGVAAFLEKRRADFTGQ